jgi:hypothetical protein
MRLKALISLKTAIQRSNPMSFAFMSESLLTGEWVTLRKDGCHTTLNGGRLGK